MKIKHLLLGIVLMQTTAAWAMDGLEFIDDQYKPVTFPPMETNKEEATPPAFLDDSYGKVAIFNKLLHLTHDLSSDNQNKPQHALTALFGNSSGEINSLWKTSPFRWEYHKEKPSSLGALRNRLERYTEPQKKYAIFKTHLNLVKAVAENLLHFKKQHMVSENTNSEIKENIQLLGNHMKLLSKIISLPNISYWAIQDDLKDYRQWLGDVEANTSKAVLLLEAYSGLYDWEFVQSSGPLEIGPVVTVKDASQVVATASDSKDETKFYHKKKDKYDQGRLKRPMDLVEIEEKQVNEHLSLYHQTEIVRISDEQEDRYLAQSIENGKGPIAKVKDTPQFSTTVLDNKDTINSYLRKKDTHDQEILKRHIGLAEDEREQGNEHLSLYHQTEIVRISDEQEDRYLAQSIENGKGPIAKVKDTPQFSTTVLDNKDTINSYLRKKDTHDQEILKRHIGLAEDEREQGNEHLSLYHQTEIVRISDEQEDRYLAQSIENGSPSRDQASDFHF